MNSKEKRFYRFREYETWAVYFTVYLWPLSLYRLLNVRLAVWSNFVFEVVIMGVGFTLNIAALDNEVGKRE